MLLFGVKEEGNWLLSRWNLTYGTGWDGIKRAAKSVYAFYTGLEILADQKPVEVKSLEDIEKIPEAASLIVRGVSTILKVPVMMSFYNQTKIVDVNVAKANEEFAEADYQKFNLSLCQYMDSIEIAMNKNTSD